MPVVYSLLNDKRKSANDGKCHLRADSCGGSGSGFGSVVSLSPSSATACSHTSAQMGS
jgi:hypothetical protein